ncbi:MAG: beta-propeller fold lactonase family protein, partial [Planctomycetes bacterium]|nr:beta-propeller fold lactonase family protein [Planctomycetota bacterium]
REARSVGALRGGPRVAVVAVDADQEFGLLFSNPVAPQNYVVQVIGAVSDIYMRDFDVKLQLGLVRVWFFGNEPFSADNLSGFANYWESEEDPSPYDLIHLFSGRRDTGYGGVAYVSGVCSGFAYGISAYMLGSFPSPVVGSDLGNWDVVVCGHEMGHNMGTFHTHDGYSPAIDQCGSGIHSRGTIMSYCHTTAGGLLNIEMRFHARVQQFVESDLGTGPCLWFDCNDNGLPDADDIANSDSDDVNGNGIPDECEDCNANGTLDDADILGGAPDVDGNDIPDECEADCDLDGTPDEYQISLGLAQDDNGNLVPDDCEADCDANGTPDFAQIAANGQLDIDRNTVLDVCQDCDGNGSIDWIDLQRQFNIFVVETGGFVREFHADSGVAIGNLAQGMLASPTYLAFGPDRQLYATSFGDDRVVRIDVDTGSVSDFVSAGSGGLNGPTGLVFRPNGNLLVAGNLTASVIEYDGVTGAAIGTFVAAGAGGLTGPYAITYSPQGDLLVTSSTNSVLVYSGTDGSFLETLVSPGSGGLNAPRDLLFKPNGNLLVSSLQSDAILEYDATGSFVGVFNDAVTPTGAWGLATGPNGNVFVVRNSGTIRVVEYDMDSGRYVRSFIRGSTDLTAPAALAFRPPSDNDCNQNRVVDECDITSGASTDLDGNGVPDECDPLPEVPSANIDETRKNRYVSFTPVNTDTPIAFQIELIDCTYFPDSAGVLGWVGEPDGDDTSIVVPAPYFSDNWPAALHVGDCEIVLVATYGVRASFNGFLLTDALELATIGKPGIKYWGDCIGSFDGDTWSGPDDVTNFVDVQAGILAFVAGPGAPPLTWLDIEPDTPNRANNFADVRRIVQAFRAEAYPFPDPSDCP